MKFFIKYLILCVRGKSDKSVKVMWGTFWKLVDLTQTERPGYVFIHKIHVQAYAQLL